MVPPAAVDAALLRTAAGPGLEGTNNVTARALGRCGQIRYKSMRGSKSRQSWQRTLELFALNH